MPVFRINEFTAADGQAEALHALLQGLVPYISGSEGCLGCEVLRGVEDRGRFVVLERWTSVEAHRQALAGFPKEQMAAAGQLLGAPPRGTYYQP